MTRARELGELCGALIVSGMPGPSLDPETARALSAQRRAGVILFKRNIESVDALHGLSAEILAAAASDHHAIIGVDQEGGRVIRIPEPAIQLPTMRTIGDLGRPGLARRSGATVGAELLAMGVNVAFAPVLDVDTNPGNPIIGNRSFGSDPDLVADMGAAFVDGLQARGVVACGKHFPGHGDTTVDSHLALPRVAHPLERLESVELVPFRRVAIRARAFMSAHVVYDALDPGVPATLSQPICKDLLRRRLGFRGVLFSDDLEMRAIADRYGIEQAAVLAVRAGCDILLVCRDGELADRAHEALVREAEAHPEFLARCRDAAERSRSLRRTFPCRPAPSRSALHRVLEESGASGLLTDLNKHLTNPPPRPS